MRYGFFENHKVILVFHLAVVNEKTYIQGVDSAFVTYISRSSPHSGDHIGVCGLREKLPVAQSISAKGKESALILI
jgi:hypothetical protein